MKALLVEDNPADVRLIREMLKELPAGAFEFQQAGRLHSALERLRQETFDVLLLDLGLPDSQGMETLILAEKASGGLPIVVLTGLDDERFALDAVRAGAQDYLVKGQFDSELLLRTVRYAVERKRAEEEVRRLNAELERRVTQRTAQLQAANDELVKEIVERERAETALANAKRALERERDLLQAVMDGATNSHLVYLDRDFNFVHVNKIFAASCGCRPEEMTGKNYFALYPHPENEPIFTRVRDTGEPVEYRDKPFEFPRQPQRGVTYWDWTLTPVKDPAGNVEGLIFSLYETTAHKLAEQALVRAEKLAAAGRMAATVAHEINNPLEAMTNVVYLLGQSITDTSTREYLDLLEKQLQTISRVTIQTLKFHRENGQPSEFQLSELIGELLDFYEPKARGQGVTMVKRLEAEGNMIGFSGEIRQVISNLLLNAIEATPENGRVTVHLYGATDWRNPDRRGYRISIADTGTGIDARHRSRIFEPFFTTKGDQGTGLGLWVSMGIIDRARGFLRVWSTQRPGRSGTCFSVFLPAQVPPPKTPGRRRYEAAQEGSRTAYHQHRGNHHPSR